VNAHRPIKNLGPTSVANERDRKAEHIRLALDERMQLAARYFDHYELEHCALPEIDFADIDARVVFLKRRLAAPLLISCMTGGTEEATEINRNLARAAEQAGIAVGVGSQRKAFENPEVAQSFQIRPFAPTVPILANLGAVQLNYGFDVDHCRRAVEMIEADALVLHLNPLQEAIQPEGQTNFADLLPKIGAVARQLEVPVIVKEIGSGISADVARRLLAEGVEIIDCAGLGGTTWARIEAARTDEPELGERFANWGIPTPRAIRALREVDGLIIIGSGGVRHGLDLAKAIACGANLGGMAFQFLSAATDSSEAVLEKIERTVRELKIAMFCVGARTVDKLRSAKLVRRSEWS
jgi:isopentenyl-diphosphate delta-isomerase